MAFCSSCGARIEDGAKFCPYCGEKSANTVKAEAHEKIREHEKNMEREKIREHEKSMEHEKIRTQEKPGAQGYTETRKQEYAGTVRKCPSCGMEIPGLTAICPGCGHEINSARVTEAIKDFADQISRADRAIANSTAVPKTGWKSWSGLGKAGWVLLNIYTLGIPLMIYLRRRGSDTGDLSAFAAEEKLKAELIKEQLINNYAFPNDRETILEALLYIKSQVSALWDGGIDRSSVRWINIWIGKSRQLYEKSQILFPGDEIAQKTYDDICEYEKEIQNMARKRNIIIAVIIILFFLYIVAVGSYGSHDSAADSNETYGGAVSEMTLPRQETPSGSGGIISGTKSAPVAFGENIFIRIDEPDK